MLLRWGLVYVLGVLTIILCGVVGWQRTLISAAGERHATLLEKFEALEGDAKAARIEATSATRQAADLTSRMEREKRDFEAKSSKTAAAPQIDADVLAGAIAAKSAAETARGEAETARGEAETRLASESAAKTAAEHAAIEAQAEASKQRLSAEAAVKDVEAALTELARLQSVYGKETGSIGKQRDAPQDAPQDAPDAAAAPAPEAAAPEKKATAKPSVKTSSAKPRAKSKPKADDTFFGN